MAHEIRLPKVASSGLPSFYDFTSTNINGGSNNFFQIPISENGDYIIQFEANITNISPGISQLDLTSSLGLNGSAVSGNTNSTHRITFDVGTGHVENITMTHTAKLTASMADYIGFIISPVGDIIVANSSIILTKIA